MVLRPSIPPGEHHLLADPEESGSEGREQRIGPHRAPVGIDKTHAVEPVAVRTEHTDPLVGVDQPDLLARIAGGLDHAACHPRLEFGILLVWGHPEQSHSEMRGARSWEPDEHVRVTNGSVRRHLGVDPKEGLVPKVPNFSPHNTLAKSLLSQPTKSRFSRAASQIENEG